jgi:hypothetical protein
VAFGKIPCSCQSLSAFDIPWAQVYGGRECDASRLRLECGGLWDGPCFGVKEMGNKAAGYCEPCKGMGRGWAEDVIWTLERPKYVPESVALSLETYITGYGNAVSSRLYDRPCRACRVHFRYSTSGAFFGSHFARQRVSHLRMNDRQAMVMLYGFVVQV